MTAPTREQAKALLAILDGIVEAVAAAGPIGAPGGILYAALMSAGCSFSQFNSIMGALVRAGKVVKRGDCYHLPQAS
jgi:hypothetical protein